MNRNLIDKDSTIYNYRLVKRLRHRGWVVALYISFPLLLALYESFVFQKSSGFQLLLCYLAMQAAHSSVLYLYFRWVPDCDGKMWAFSIQIPWIGRLPVSYCSLPAFTRLHLHLLGIGLLPILVIYPWITLLNLIHLFLMQIWILLPRFIILILLHKEKKFGFVKITSRDTSFYIP